MTDAPTPPPGRREQHKLDTRRALEDAALELFARDGFERTTVEAIAERAQVSPRTFFRYFATKEEVLDMGWATRRERLHELTTGAPREAHDLDVAVTALAAMAVEFEPELERVRLRAAAVATSSALRGRTADSMAASTRAQATAEQSSIMLRSRHSPSVKRTNRSAQFTAVGNAMSVRSSTCAVWAFTCMQPPFACGARANDSHPNGRRGERESTWVYAGSNGLVDSPVKSHARVTVRGPGAHSG